MSVNEIFRTEFRGYSKREVSDYIMSLNEEMEALKSELDRTEGELKKCRVELDEMQPVAVGPTEEEVAKLREKVREEIYAEIKAELKAEYDARMAEYENAKQTENTVVVDSADFAALKEKAELYDDQKDILAELMIKVKSDAAEIYAEAEQKSNKLMTDAFEKFLKLRNDFEVMRKNVEASKADMDSRIVGIKRSLDDFDQYLGFMSQDINNTADNFKQDI